MSMDLVDCTCVVDGSGAMLGRLALRGQKRAMTVEIVRSQRMKEMTQAKTLVEARRAESICWSIILVAACEE